MVACGTSGLLGGLLVDGVPFNSLMSAVPAFDLEAALLGVAFLLLLFLHS
jgi:hypothetical protein